MLTLLCERLATLDDVATCVRAVVARQGRCVEWYAMDDVDQVDAENWDDDDEDRTDAQGAPRGYARGYFHGVMMLAGLLKDLLEHGEFSELGSITEHCFRYHQLLVEWEQGSEQDPPDPPPLP